MPDQQQPHAIVTGATSGIGLAITQTLGQAGHRVFICARTAENVGATVKQLADGGLTADGAACDVRDGADVKRLVRAAVDRFGPVDVLVNSAGRSGEGSPPISATICGSTSSTPTSTASS